MSLLLFSAVGAILNILIALLIMLWKLTTSELIPRRRRRATEAEDLRFLGEFIQPRQA